MDVLRVILLFTLVSCAKMSYLAEQGIGQISLEYEDIDNEDFLKDPNYSDEHKQKVKIIMKVKDYFFKYYGLKAYPIYDEVKLLDQEAVTYLVIHSPKNEIKAMPTSFPFMGSFPYLGFFSKESAKEYKQDKEAQDFQTYMRPVYAYSTLNNPYWPFHDNILSSFFYFKEKELTRLVFHELVHTILFVGSDVTFNENLAQFVADKMMLDYYQFDQKEQQRQQENVKRNNLLKQEIVALASKLNKRYQLEKTNFDKIGDEFLQNVFKPRIKKKCAELQMKKCWPLSGPWNNARFAAFKTYEAKHNDISDLYQQLNLPLKDFVLLLIKLEKNYDADSDFISHVRAKV